MSSHASATASVFYLGIASVNEVTTPGSRSATNMLIISRDALRGVRRNPALRRLADPVMRRLADPVVRRLVDAVVGQLAVAALLRLADAACARRTL